MYRRAWVGFLLKLSPSKLILHSRARHGGVAQYDLRRNRGRYLYRVLGVRSIFWLFEAIKLC